jgi:hypothetical protein
MKTIKDAAIKLANERVPERMQFKEVVTVGNYIKEEVHDAFIRGVEFAQQWISIEDELPEIFEPVLCSNKICFFVGHFDGDNWICDLSGFIEPVTHWRKIEIT